MTSSTPGPWSRRQLVFLVVGSGIPCVSVGINGVGARDVGVSSVFIARTICM